jgi:threonine dehydratase
MRPVDLDRIEAAMALIDPVFLNSPLLAETSLDRALDARLLFKVESLNPIRSFKGRGTDLFCRQLDGAPTALVCASAGNFGQGLARAGARLGLPVVVFAAEAASRLKIDAMRALGADVRLVGQDFDAAKDAARLHAASIGGYFVEDGAEPVIAEGAGTIAVELTGAAQDLDAALIPLGNGALATGMGAWLKHAAPGARVVAVVASGAPAMRAAFETGRSDAGDCAATIADGIAVRVPVPYAVETLRQTVDDVVAVSDAQILRAMRLIHEHLGLVIEPAGAAGLAAVLADPERWRGRRIATVLCGGNVAAADLKSWLG